MISHGLLLVVNLSILSRAVCFGCLLSDSEVLQAISSRLNFEMGQQLQDGRKVVKEMYYNCVSFYNDLKTVRSMKITVIVNETGDYFAFLLRCDIDKLTVNNYFHNRTGETSNRTMCGDCSLSENSCQSE